MPRWVLSLACVLLWAASVSAQAKAPSGQPCTPYTSYTLRVPVSWQPPVLAPAAGVTLVSYLLERQTDTGPYVLVGEFPPDVLAYTDTDVAIGHTYTYQIRAGYLQADGTKAESTYTLNTPTNQPCVTMAVLPAPASLTLEKLP